MAQLHADGDEGSVGEARFWIDREPTGDARITVRRNYPDDQFDDVWRVVSDFGGIKVLFPSLVRLYLTYPDDSANQVGMIRDMTFAPPPSGGSLPFGIEQLVKVDNENRSITYTSVLGLPVENYRSAMTVTTEGGCELAWISRCRIKEEDSQFLKILASILAGGANQIATHLKS